MNNTTTTTFAETAEDILHGHFKYNLRHNPTTVGSTATTAATATATNQNGGGLDDDDMYFQSYSNSKYYPHEGNSSITTSVTIHVTPEHYHLLNWALLWGGFVIGIALASYHIRQENLWLASTGRTWNHHTTATSTTTGGSGVGNATGGGGGGSGGHGDGARDSGRGRGGGGGGGHGSRSNLAGAHSTNNSTSDMDPANSSHADVDGGGSISSADRARYRVSKIYFRTQNAHTPVSKQAISLVTTAKPFSYDTARHYYCICPDSFLCRPCLSKHIVASACISTHCISFSFMPHPVEQFRQLLLVAMVTRAIMIPVQTWSQPLWAQFIADTLPEMTFASAWTLLVSFFVQLVGVAMGTGSSAIPGLVIQVTAYIIYAIILGTFIWNPVASVLLYTVLCCIYAVLFGTALYFCSRLILLLKASLRQQQSGLAIRLITCSVLCVSVFAARTFGFARKVIAPPEQVSWWWQYGALELFPSIMFLLMINPKSPENHSHGSNNNNNHQHHHGNSGQFSGGQSSSASKGTSPASLGTKEGHHRRQDSHGSAPRGRSSEATPLLKPAYRGHTYGGEVS